RSNDYDRHRAARRGASAGHHSARRVPVYAARRRGRVQKSYQGTIDVLVPAFNEAKTICKTVAAILAARTPDNQLRVVVIDDGSKDRTSDVLLEGFPDSPRLTVLRKENGGKAAALNYGISRSTAEVIVAIDGDTILASDAIGKLTAPFTNACVG